MTFPEDSKLPISHPDYRYPVSHNIYWQRIKDLPTIAYTDNDTELHRGRWREHFRDTKKFPQRELHVELGCNAGHVLTAWAKANPQNAYIGVDWKYKAIHRCAEKDLALELENAIYLRAHIDRIHYMFGPGEINQLNIFFPDPWPKKSRWKNRFVSLDKLALFAPLMAPNGEMFIKTDHDGYFEWMLEAFENCDKWKIRNKTFDLHAGNPDAGKLTWPDVTLFESVFIKESIPIKALWARPTR